MTEQTNDKGVGPIIGTIIVIIVIIMGGFYFLGQRTEKLNTNNNEIANPTATTSDEVSSLQDDINSLDVDSLGNSVDNL
jgi:FlaG/FlaF family flagellin (archaellin)